MEPDHSIVESSDDAITSTTVDESSTQTSAGRSYECNFCKRGFTNAQALGGHMNIHRKHKAKLKESSSSSSPPPVTTTGNPFSSSPEGKNKPLPLFGEGLSDSRDVHQENKTVDPLSPVPDIDLELRLGHTQSTGNKNTTTRKFF